MKILHVPYCYFPDPAGGTEIYVQALAREQRSRGIEVEIAAPAASESTYDVEGVTVRRFATSADLSREELYGDGDPVAAHSFAATSLAGNPDVVHLHAYTPAVSNRLLGGLRASGKPVVFTFHSPAVTCARGDLLFFGERVCEGRMLGYECSACKLHSLGLNADVSKALASIPAGISTPLAAFSEGKLTTGFAMRRLIERRNRAAAAFLSEVQQIIAVSDWVREVLIRNNVPLAKITLVRHGLPQKREAAICLPLPDTPLRLVFLGRLDKTKGIQMLVEAVTASDAQVILDIYGTAQDGSAIALRNRLVEIATRSSRVRVFPAVPSEQVLPLLANYHALAVPSQCVETGPLVVYEAFAAGLPILGSKLGGIAELVTNGKNGFLLRHQSTEDWRKAIEFLAGNPAMLKRLSANVSVPRTMSQVADDMNSIYASILHSGVFSLQQ